MYGQDLLKMHKRILKQTLSLYIYTYYEEAMFSLSWWRFCSNMDIMIYVYPYHYPFSSVVQPFFETRDRCARPKNPCLVASCLGAKETQTPASSYHWDECGRVASWQM